MARSRPTPDEEIDSGVARRRTAVRRRRTFAIISHPDAGNKLDLPSRDPFELLDEIEKVLGIHAAPANWPIGSGDRFTGVYELQSSEVRL